MDRSKLGVAVGMLGVLGMFGCGGAGAGAGVLDPAGSPTVVDPTGELPTTSTGPWADSPADRIPCGQILDCRSLCAGDAGCLDECYQAADPAGRALVDEVDACWVANGCQDEGCLQAACPATLDACRTQVPSGGVVCTATGVYELCTGAFCNEFDAIGAGWGSTVDHGGFWATFDCTLAMQDALVLASINNQSAGTVRSCAPVQCEAN